MGGTKEIDAVCVTSREHDEPELYKWNYQQLVNSDRIISQSAYKTMWDEKEFAGEAVSIVEVKSDSPNWEGVGQLVGYKELIMDEWDVFVPDMCLVASDKDPVIERACERLGIDSVSTNL